MVFEDLTKRDYTMKYSQLNLHEAKIAFTKLARWHAASMFLADTVKKFIHSNLTIYYPYPFLTATSYQNTEQGSAEHGTIRQHEMGSQHRSGSETVPQLAWIWSIRGTPGEIRTNICRKGEADVRIQ